MSSRTFSIVNVKTLDDARKEIEKIGSDPKSIDIMAPKAISKVIRVEDVLLQDTIIIKQDMLSLGGEVAIPRHAFELRAEGAPILIMGTLKQLHELVEKLSRHYPRLKTIAKELSTLLKQIE